MAAAAIAEHLQDEGLREAEVQMGKRQVGGGAVVIVKRHAVGVVEVEDGVVVFGGLEDLEDAVDQRVVAALEPFFEREDDVLGLDQAGG